MLAIRHSQPTSPCLYSEVIEEREVFLLSGFEAYLITEITGYGEIQLIYKQSTHRALVLTNHTEELVTLSHVFTLEFSTEKNLKFSKDKRKSQLKSIEEKTKEAKYLNCKMYCFDLKIHVYWRPG